MPIVLSAVAIAVTSCVSGHPPRTAGRLMPRITSPQSAASVLTGTPAALAAETARELFSFAPVVVVASPGRPSVLATAVRQARRARAPLLLAWFGASQRPGRSPAGSTSSVVRAAIEALHPRAVLAVGVSPGLLAARLPGLSVVTSPALLPATDAPPPLRQVALLLHQGIGPASVAMASTAQLAGVRVITVRDFDLRTDPAAITALSAARPRHVLAAGAGFGPAGQLAARVAVAATGVQLPGGGQVLFPGHRLVALYGHPGAPALGALGEQGLAASTTRIRRLAARYRPLSAGVPVVPAFEIIATVAQGRDAPEADGSYSYETPVSQLRPWVRSATADGLYVVLDLQAGRASLLTQARQYRSLLALPDVGLALDPEWKLGPRQFPLHQIGSVTIGEVNSVISWLARLTERYHLPQKLLVLHQFRLSMITGEQRLDTRERDLAIIIHMDGQGTPNEKQQTWDAVLGAAPPGVFFGWKDFFVKDHPMLTPHQTMARTPKPVMISYQ